MYQIDDFIQEYVSEREKEVQRCYYSLSELQTDEMFTLYESELRNTVFSRFEEGEIYGLGTYGVRAFVWSCGRTLWEVYIDRYDLVKYYEIDFHHAFYQFCLLLEANIEGMFSRNFYNFITEKERKYFEDFHEKHKKLNIKTYENLLSAYVFSNLSRRLVDYRQEFFEKENEMKAV